MINNTAIFFDESFKHSPTSLLCICQSFSKRSISTYNYLIINSLEQSIFLRLLFEINPCSLFLKMSLIIQM